MVRRYWQSFLVKRIIAETGAGQHGVATATIAARLGLECVVYMGAEDVKRQAMNVYRMRLLGATVVPVQSGSKTLKDAMNEAMRDWVTNVDTTYYVIGTVAGPHPYPELVRDFQSIIGRSTQTDFGASGSLTRCISCLCWWWFKCNGPVLSIPKRCQCKMYGVEAAGFGIETGKHSAPLNAGHVGVLHGNRTYLMSDEQGQIIETHSISAGLDYPGVGPEHSFLKDMKRVEYVPINDTEALQGFRDLTKIEGIIPRLESSHAMAYVSKLAPTMSKDQIIIATVSGRGDKDLMTVARIDGVEMVEM